MKNPNVRKSYRHLSCCRMLFLVPALLACFALSPPGQAQFCRDGCFFDDTWQGKDALMHQDGMASIFFSTAFGDSALKNTTDSVSNTAIGYEALMNDTEGNNNTAIGDSALRGNTTGDFNTATGIITLANNTTGEANTATGADALFSNTTGDENTATGASALSQNSTGIENTATGNSALLLSTTGSFNTATGYRALQGTFEESTGSYNTANGFQALLVNTTGSSNTANGVVTLYSNTTGGFNTANGANSLQSNTTGDGNVANGGFALASNTTGSSNIAEGFDALFHNTTGSHNIGIGLAAGSNLTTGSHNIEIGNAGVAGESKTIRIGTQDNRESPGQTRTFVAGIFGVAVRGTPVFVTADGQLGTTPSSQRFKKEIKPMDSISEAILALQPVTFCYKTDHTNTPQFGLIAEEVAKVNRDLVLPDKEGKPYTVRYEAVNAMLLNEFLKEHQIVQELKKQVAELTAGLQKVSVELALSKSAPQTVFNNR